MKPPPMLSLSMIVRNEALRLERCLTSVAGFVDEMVLLDTGSTDDTVAIAKRCGAVVHSMPWPGDFAPARNEALRRVGGDWVLVLDADEQLLESAHAPLREWMRQPDVLLVNLLRFERGARQSPYSSVSRLFRRHPALHWSRAYHSQIDDSVLALIQQEPGWRIVDCAEPALVHDGYTPELLATGDKAHRLRRAMEQELARDPHDPYACAKLGSLEVSEGHRDRGIALLQRGLQHCPATAVPERYELLLHLGLALAPRHPQQAAGLYRQALDLGLPARVSLGARLNLAALLCDSGQLVEAAALCRGAIQAAPEVGLAWYNLGLIERRQGQLPGAITAYRQALGLDPGHAEAHQNLAVALLMSGDIVGARAGFRQAIGLLQQQGRTAEAEDLRRRAASLVKLED
ncbi:MULTISPECIES: glycosyltransferase [Aphanothece]|uniref:glycosyltransferase n=1 Tax=Aphanothece TaxID=1121 RepID=UPI00398EB870